LINPVFVCEALETGKTSEDVFASGLDGLGFPSCGVEGFQSFYSIVSMFPPLRGLPLTATTLLFPSSSKFLDSSEATDRTSTTFSGYDKY